MLIPISSIPNGPITCIPIAGGACESNSIIFSSISPFFNFIFIHSRVFWFWYSSEFTSSCFCSVVWDGTVCICCCGFFTGGIRISSILSSAISSAFDWTSFVFSAFTILTEKSVKSRIIDSTSLPTYPTSVNFEASTFTKGAAASLESLLEISVLPTPVGPIKIILLGRISSRRTSSICCLRHRFLNAIATARLASVCPMIYLSSSSTILLGVNSFIVRSFIIKIKLLNQLLQH